MLSGAEQLTEFPEEMRTDSLHSASDSQSAANLGTLTAVDTQQEGASTKTTLLPAAAHPTAAAGIASNRSADVEMTTRSSTTGHPTHSVESAASKSQISNSYKSAETEDDPFKLTGSSNLAAPRAVEETMNLSSTPQR